MKTIVSVIAIAMATLSANAQKLKEREVSIVIKDAFKKAYPYAEDAKWEKEDGKYEVEFELGEQEQSVLLDHDGTVLETEIEIAVSQLPAAIKESVAKNYNGAKIKEAAKTTDAKGIVSYEAEIKGKDLIFDCTYTLLKEVIN